MNKVNILWTAGWDSTFRLLQLASYENIEIQPYYINDPNRHGAEYERRAMNRILDEIEKSDKFPAAILPIIEVEKSWILRECADKTISKAFNHLYKKYGVGTQYEWFALYAKHLNVKFESAVVHQYHGKVENAIDAEGELVLVSDDFLENRWMVIDKDDNKTVSVVFDNLILPAIKYSKKDEENIARENGWIEIMKLTWFCHMPINGEPCGFCNPCEDAMNTGMEWRMPESAVKRYRHRAIYRKIRLFLYYVNRVLEIIGLKKARK